MEVCFNCIFDQQVLHIAHFHWTVLDNPMFPRWAGKSNWRELAAEWWADKIKREGWADDARRVAEQGQDALVWPELPTAADEEWVW